MIEIQYRFEDLLSPWILDDSEKLGDKLIVKSKVEDVGKPVSNWDSGVTYAKDDYVYNEGKLYQSLDDNNTSETTDQDYWDLEEDTKVIINVGIIKTDITTIWDNETTFEKDILVQHNEKIYRSLEENTGIEPSNESDEWLEITKIFLVENWTSHFIEIKNDDEEGILISPGHYQYVKLTYSDGAFSYVAEDSSSIGNMLPGGENLINLNYDLRMLLGSDRIYQMVSNINTNTMYIDAILNRLENKLREVEVLNTINAIEADIITETTAKQFVTKTQKDIMDVLSYGEKLPTLSAHESEEILRNKIDKEGRQANIKIYGDGDDNYLNVKVKKYGFEGNDYTASIISPSGFAQLGATLVQKELRIILQTALGGTTVDANNTLENIKIQIEGIEIDDEPVFEVDLFGNEDSVISFTTDIKVDFTEGITISSVEFTETEKNKLGDIQSGATRYIHPSIDGWKHLPQVTGANNKALFHVNNTTQWKNIQQTDVAGLPDVLNSLNKTVNLAVAGEKIIQEFDYTDNQYSYALGQGEDGSGMPIDLSSDIDGKTIGFVLKGGLAPTNDLYVEVENNSNLERLVAYALGGLILRSVGEEPEVIRDEIDMTSGQYIQRVGYNESYELTALAMPRREIFDQNAREINISNVEISSGFSDGSTEITIPSTEDLTRYIQSGYYVGIDEEPASAIEIDSIRYDGTNIEIKVTGDQTETFAGTQTLYFFKTLSGLVIDQDEGNKLIKIISTYEIDSEVLISHKVTDGSEYTIMEIAPDPNPQPVNGLYTINITLDSEPNLLNQVVNFKTAVNEGDTIIKVPVAYSAKFNPLYGESGDQVTVRSLSAGFPPLIENSLVGKITGPGVHVVTNVQAEVILENVGDSIKRIKNPKTDSGIEFQGELTGNKEYKFKLNPPDGISGINNNYDIIHTGNFLDKFHAEMAKGEFKMYNSSGRGRFTTWAEHGVKKFYIQAGIDEDDPNGNLALTGAGNTNLNSLNIKVNADNATINSKKILHEGSKIKPTSIDMIDSMIWNNI